MTQPRYFNGTYYSGEPIVFSNPLLEAPPRGYVVQNYDRTAASIVTMTGQKPSELADEFFFPQLTKDAVALDPRSERACQWIYDRHTDFFDIARRYRNYGFLVGNNRSFFEYYHMVSLNMVIEKHINALMAGVGIEVMHAEMFDKGAILVPLNQKRVINENPDLICLFAGVERTLEIQMDYLGYMLNGSKWHKDGNGNLKPINRGFIDYRSNKYQTMTTYLHDAGNGRMMLPLVVNVDVKNRAIAVIDLEYEDTVAQHIDKHYGFGGKQANRVFKDDIDLAVFPFADLKKGSRAFEPLKRYFTAEKVARRPIHRIYPEAEYDQKMALHQSHRNDLLASDYEKCGQILIPTRNVKVMPSYVKSPNSISLGNGKRQMLFDF